MKQVVFELSWLDFVFLVLGGVSRSNLKNYRQIALTLPTLGIRQTSGGSRLASDIRQTLSGESGTPDQTWQTLSADSVPALPTPY